MLGSCPDSPVWEHGGEKLTASVASLEWQMSRTKLTLIAPQFPVGTDLSFIRPSHSNRHFFLKLPAVAASAMPSAV